jgi:hypothetical protein
MMTGQRCDCCDLPAYSCGKAAEDRQRRDVEREKQQLLAHPAWMAALYPGACERCGERFEPGTPIRRTPLGWRAQCCSEGLS